jgi:hypothetical protein
VADSYIGGGNWSTQRKPPPCRKSLTNLKAAMWLVNLSLRVTWLEFVKILIFITVDIFKHTAEKNKKIKPADKILPEVYGTTLIQI